MNDSQSNISVEASDMEARYQQAQALLQGFCTKNLVQNDTLFPHWIESTDCFWYERATRLGEEPTVKIGKEFRLVDAKAAINAAALLKFGLVFPRLASNTYTSSRRAICELARAASYAATISGTGLVFSCLASSAT